MKRLLFLILSAILFSSCLTVKQIERNCDKFAKICTTPQKTVIEYRDTTIYVNDTVYFNLPPDTVKLVQYVTVTGNNANLQPVKRKKGLIWMEASIKNNWLTVNAGLTDSTILIPHRDTVFLNDALQTTTQTNTITIEKKYIPKFYKFTFWFFTAAVSVFVIYLFLTGKITAISGSIKKIFF